MYNIICPYCFSEFTDEEVHFRSELVSEDKDNPIPDEYSDIEDFKSNFKGTDLEKQRILVEYDRWNFFRSTKDEKYEKFWSKYYGGTTEFSPADDKLNIKAYNRRVIEPQNANHQKYLIPQGEDYFIRDQGMVSQIRLPGDVICHRRVCPYCHNPLPVNYGKSTVKFVTLIGITGAGKTVYLSQLLKGMNTYVPKVGMSAMVTTASARMFVEKNKVAAGEMLPGSTPVKSFQQPLFYDIIRNNPNNRHDHITETFVLYDIAGEIFKDEYNQDIPNFAKFISKADGIILLIDPYQFESVNTVNSKNVDNKVTPSFALKAIHGIIDGNTEKLCKTPVAVCVSKIDTQSVQEVLQYELRQLLVEPLNGIKGNDGYCKPIFKASSHNPIAMGLHEFIMEDDPDLSTTLHTNYLNYSYFAFTALGCNVTEETIEKNGEEIKVSTPEGPVLPKRIEEPLFWLFKNFGYITSDVRCFNTPIICPVCHTEEVFELPEDQRTVKEKVGIFKTITRKVNYKCAKGHKWWQD